MLEEKIATREAYGKVLVKLGEERPEVVVLDADLAKSTKTIAFKKQFPDRFFDCGVAEANMVGMAAGLAASGKIPFCSTFAVFATGRAFDQIRQSVANTRLPVKIAASHAGLTVGEDGSSHQSVADIALMRVLPNFTVFVPADAAEVEGAVQAAAAIQGPVYIRLGRSPVPRLHDESFTFTPGRAVWLRRGSDATVVACGIMVEVALRAAQTLDKEGLDVGVLDMHTLKPLDVEALVEAAESSKAVVTAEEHSIIGGLGGAVAETLAEHYPVPLQRVGIHDTFGESGKPGELLMKYDLTDEHIAQAVREVIRRKG